MGKATRKRQKYKSFQSVYKVMHSLEQVPKEVAQKQAIGKWQ